MEGSVFLPQSAVPAQDFHRACADLCATVGTNDPSSESDPRCSRLVYVWKSGSATRRFDWKQQVAEGGFLELQRFAKGLERDQEAVLAGLSQSYSNGMTEGFVNKLKLSASSFITALQKTPLFMVDFPTVSIPLRE